MPARIKTGILIPPQLYKRINDAKKRKFMTPADLDEIRRGGEFLLKLAGDVTAAPEAQKSFKSLGNGFLSCANFIQTLQDDVKLLQAEVKRK